MEMQSDGIKERALRVLGHQEWLPLGARLRAISRLCDPERSPAKGFEVDFFGFKYAGDLNCYLDWWVYFFGAYEKQELFCLRDLFLARKNAAAFIDIGANVGHHSLFMARYAQRVHSFEPWEKVRNRLLEKIAINGLENITVHPCGLGRDNMQLDFFAPRGANTGTGSFSPEHATDRNRLCGKLQVVKGDDYFRANGIGCADVIKIDVEGFERNVLEGLHGTLRENRPAVFMEWSDTTRKSFKDASEMHDCVPEGYVFLTVRTTPTSYSYEPFDFHGRNGNVLLLPHMPARRSTQRSSAAAAWSGAI